MEIVIFYFKIHVLHNKQVFLQKAVSEKVIECYEKPWISIYCFILYKK